MSTAVQSPNLLNSMQEFWNSSALEGENQTYLEQQYEAYIRDPNSVAPEWQRYFAKIGDDNVVLHSEVRQEFINLAYRPRVANRAVAVGTNIEHERKQMYVHDLINGYRLLGHLHSNIDPLQLRTNPNVPELELNFYNLSHSDFATKFDSGTLHGPKIRSLQDIVADLQRIYCGSIAAEYMHIPNSKELAWLQSRIEASLYQHNLSTEIQRQILYAVIAAEGLEKYLGAKFPGAKRFSLEGCDSLIVALDALVQYSGELGFQEMVIGMAHRGRLNVLVNILGKMPVELFDEFEGKHSLAVESGDVKYHQGFSSDVKVADGYMHLSLAFNPSHLEIVTPVVSGSVCARQQRRSKDGKMLVLPLAIHGDAAFSGQGIVMETLNMSQTRGYAIGGTIHVIINNQIGFTTSNVDDMRSTLYCSDIGKMLSVPILHVNADDPEAVYTVMAIALAYRNKFAKDVIIDLIGYRRHGHNEADEPTVTQPRMYSIIKQRPTVTNLYAEQLIQRGSFSAADIEAMHASYRQSLDERNKAVARHLVDKNWKSAYATDWTGYGARDWRTNTSTALPLEQLVELANTRDTVPVNYKLHPLVQRIVESRRKMTAGELPIDWGYAETLAYATILVEGYAVRLSGQDSGRGTFFHRHAVLHDQNTGENYIPLANLSASQGKFWVIDSLLSEAAVLGFEYGYSTSEPRTLVIWEAQFGDFANNAQVVIDQFISSGEQKWGRLSGLVMLLPHGYEGQGPEHSSARLERFLQLCAQGNLQVCVPSTPAQIYHMLRRQMLRPMRKPLIVLTPKSLLRHKQAISTMKQLAQEKFYPVLADVQINPQDQQQTAAINRVILCSGKVYYDLADAREQQKRTDVAIIRIEQLHPFPEQELQAELQAYPNVKTVVWCQEEPQNQGAWYSSQHHFRRCLRRGQKLRYAGREASAAPAVGYAHLHNQQQQQLIADAFNN